MTAPGADERPPGPDPEQASRSTPRRTTAASVGRGARRAAGAGGRGLRSVGVLTGSAAARSYRLARRASHAEGAGDSGLYRLIELHAFNAAGDAAVAISLAGTLFFQMPSGEDTARGQVALFLGLTMLPFAVVAPLVGPFLDRFGHGRRWAVGATMAVRAFLCWVLAGTIADESLAMFPAALGVLVASKAYGVTRAAAVPRLAPPQLGLVKANSRISLAGITGAAVSAPLAVVAAHFGSEWSLRYAFVVFVAATILAVLLPARVDSAAGEVRVRLAGHAKRRARVPASVVVGLRANAGLRLLSGFLTLFMAFLLRAHPFESWPWRPELLLGLVIGAAGLGNTIGIGLGNVLRRVRPLLSVRIAIFAGTIVTIGSAVWYTLPSVVLLALTAGLAQSFGKLSLDSMLQSEIAEQARSSAFARSETLLQLSWVTGAFLGIALPNEAQLGLGVLSAVLVAACAWVVAGARRPSASGSERGRSEDLDPSVQPS